MISALARLFSIFYIYIYVIQINAFRYLDVFQLFIYIFMAIFHQSIFQRMIHKSLTIKIMFVPMVIMLSRKTVFDIVSL